MTSAPPKTHFLSTSDEQALYQWTAALVTRFPKRLDSRFLKGLFPLLGPGISPSFVKERSLFHLKRLLLTQFFLQKKVESDLALRQDSLVVRVFSVDSRICIAAAYRRKTVSLTQQTLLEIASQKIPALKKIEASSYHWDSQTLPYNYCYVELEKMRGKQLFAAEIKELAHHLTQEIPHRLSALSTFWPYNDEEAFKQLLILAKEVSSEKDAPQVSLHFQKQTATHVEFIIYLARPSCTFSEKTPITSCCFPASVQLIPHLRKKLQSKIPTVVEAFSLLIPLEKHRQRSAVNVLHARKHIARLLKNGIGTFRDYNGGLFEIQRKRFKQLSALFSKKIPHFSIFAKELFYALMPIEVQMSVHDALFEELFTQFSQTLGRLTPDAENSHSPIAIFAFQDSHKLSLCLDEAKKLQTQKKIIAHANIKVLSHHYLCLLGEADLSAVKRQISQVFHKEQETLFLSLSQGHLPSLSPYYLGKELHGRSIAKLLFEGLVRIHPDQKIACAGCEKMQVSEDGRCYLFKIRDQEWSDGTKVTAFHYERAWKENVSKEGGYHFFYDFENVHQSGVKALDDKHLQVRILQKCPDFLARLTHPIFFPSLDPTSEPTAFNGPYSFGSLSDELMILEKNPYYWDSQAIFFDQVKVSYGETSASISRLYQKGQLDWVGSPFNWTSHQVDSHLFFQKSVSLPYLIYLNTRCFLLSSPFIRQALSCVIDRPLLAKRLTHCEALTVLPLAGLDAPTCVCTEHDPKKGKALFKKGMKELGVTRASSLFLKLAYWKQGTSQCIAEYLKKCWENSLGICVQLECTTWNNFYQKLERRSHQIAGAFKPMPHDPLFFLHPLTSEKENRSNWENPQCTQLVRLYMQEKNEQRKKTYLEGIERILLEEMPIIPLVSYALSYRPRPDIKGYVIDQEGSVDFRFASRQNTPIGYQACPCDQKQPPSNRESAHSIAIH